MSRLMIVSVIGLLSCDGDGESNRFASRPDPAQPGTAMPNSQPDGNLVGGPNEPKNLRNDGPPPRPDASVD
jgi:hypothetical protein